MDFIRSNGHIIYLVVTAMLMFIVVNATWYHYRNEHDYGEDIAFNVLLCLIWPIWAAIGIGAAMVWSVGAILTSPARIAVAIHKRRQRKTP